MEDAVDNLSWTSWPARERPGAALLTAAVVLALASMGALLAGSFWVGAAVVAAFLLALVRFWFPVRCRIAGGYATVHTLIGVRSRPLAGMRRIDHDARAVLLSTRAPAAAPGRRDLLMPLPAKGGEVLVRQLLDIAARHGPTSDPRGER